MRTFFIIIVISILIYSCTEEFNLDFPNNAPKLVIEGVVTNQSGPNYVKLSLSKSTFTSQNQNDTISETWLFDGFQPITDALVIISDNYGKTDTLINSPDSAYSYNYDMEGNIIDSVFMINPKGHFLGYYQTQTLLGKPGNTYFLSVKWNSKEYTSSCFMPQVPKIDSVTYFYTIAETGKSNYYIPHIWFTDNPTSSDYYLFNTEGGGGVWGRAVLSDVNMQSDVTGLDVFKGESHDWWMQGYPAAGNYYKIKMYSVTKEIYDYYNALIAQFRTDGGIYTPSPASPPSNISNGGLGFFRASAVQVVDDIMPYPPIE